MRLGYENVYRYPYGYQGWQKRFAPEETGAAAEEHGLLFGDCFPACRITLLGGELDRQLGLPVSKGTQVLNDIPYPYLLVAYVSSMCTVCLEELPVYRQAFQVITTDPSLAKKVTMIGFGADDSPRAVMRLRREMDLNFPLCPDQEGFFFEDLHERMLPMLFLLHKGEKGLYRVVWKKHGATDAESILNDVLNAVSIGG